MRHRTGLNSCFELFPFENRGLWPHFLDGRPDARGLLHWLLRLCDTSERRYLSGMCRNIRPLFNFEPPATDEEVRAAALQYVRKVSGTRKPSGKNIPVFEQAVEDLARITRTLVDSLETTAPAKDRLIEADKARARSMIRFG